jgi:ABC-type multidrug transport system ATPase subunit
MRITLASVSKTFGREALFSGVDQVIDSGSRTAILGPNGSGKSTLLQVIAGAMLPTKGEVKHELNGSTLEHDVVYKHVSIAAPYLSVYEDLSLRETLDLHIRLKPLLNRITGEELARIALLERHLNKPVRNFSSGMKQRLKLALAILSDTSLLLLDEPCTNLDTQGSAWFRELLLKDLGTRTLLVASNRQQEETFACTASIEVERWKR